MVSAREGFVTGKEKADKSILHWPWYPAVLTQCLTGINQKKVQAKYSIYQLCLAVSHWYAANGNVMAKIRVAIIHDDIAFIKKTSVILYLADINILAYFLIALPIKLLNIHGLRQGFDQASEQYKHNIICKIIVKYLCQITWTEILLQHNQTL